MASWADIQKLASDLQRVQLSHESKKLSEVNCVEVLQKLISSRQINVVFTRDGHSYVTKQHLETEIKNECIAAGGRTPLTEIAVALNIDFDHIERAARHAVSNNDEFTLSNSELFAAEYVLRLRNELRELLDEHGSRTIAALCKHWELSPELLQSLLIEKLNSAEFRGVVDGDTIYTTSYLESKKMALRAVLIAITKTTPISVIQKRIGLTQKQFWIAYENLTAIGEIPGNLVGSRTSPACSYRPKVYDELVQSYILNQYRQNEYLQISTLKTLGVDSKSALEDVLGVGTVRNMISLHSIYLKNELLDQCIQAAREDMEKSGIVEVRQSLQSLSIPFDTVDEDCIGKKIVEADQSSNFANGFVFKSSILIDSLKSIDNQLEAKAQKEVEKLEKDKNKQGGSKQTGNVQTEADEWSDGKKGGKGGKKSSKGVKSGNKASAVAPNSPSMTVPRIDDEELRSWICESRTFPEELTDVLVEKLNQEAGAILCKKVQRIQASQVVANAANTKKSLTLIANKCRQIYNSFTVFEAATTSFAEPLGRDLRHYLLKTIGVDLALAILSYVTGVDNSLQTMKEKHREETIDALPEMIREPLRVLFLSVKSTDDDAIENFNNAVEDCSQPSVTSLNLRKPDKKKG
uniref:E3 UFM1-protein ligase 1 homolog n=1 Tax=Caenorhabditis tropicalis TaxID=1561998 RepID=A0A1I7V4P1_9PELO